MRFYPPSGFQATHHCTLVCFVLIILVCLSTSQIVELISFPTRWQLPGRFEHVSIVGGAASFTKAQLQVKTILSEPYAASQINVLSGCYALLGGDVEPTLIDVQTLMITQDEFLFTIEMDDATNTPDIRWICDVIQLTYASTNGQPQPTTRTDVSIQMRLKIDDVDDSNYTSLSHIEVTPTMTHDYSWSNQLNSINIKFTFYCPTAFLENVSTVLVIDHPLLDIASITSIHSSSNVNAWDDYAKPYHLFEPDVIPSFTEIECYDHVFQFINGNIGYQFVPSAIPEQPYLHCTFEMQYPPDYIGYVLAHHPTGRIINTHTSDEWEFDMKRPGVIIGSPPVIDYENLPPVVAVWAGPHHNRDTFPQFEFGIAQRSYKYYDQDGLQFQPSPSKIRIEAYAYGHGGSLFQFINGWEPIVKCKRYDEDDYQFIFESNVFTIPTHRYDGLGMTCQLSLTPPPSILAYDQGSLSIFFFNHDTEEQLHLLQYNPYHTPSTTPVYLLNNMNHIDHTKLPAIQPMEWNAISEGGARFVVATCHLQYLLDRPMDLDHKTTLTFVFPDYLSIDDILPPEVNRFGLITVASREYTWQNNVVSTKHSRGNFHEFMEDNEVDSIDLVFQKGRPIRSPSFQVVLEKIKYEVTQPLSITIKLPINSDADIDELRIFPIFGIAGQPDAYMPQLALITPTLPTPLTGYSYRCVTWDRMVAPYVYDVSSPTVTDDNSSPCTFSISPQTGKVNVSDTSVWRRREFLDDEHMLSGRVCFYELAAVCVTPSIATNGSYVVHPLADCPSFLGEKHTVPCNRAFTNDENAGDHDEDDHVPAILDYSFTELNANTFKDPSSAYHQMLQVGWWYVGDPRLMVTISVRASNYHDVFKDTLTPWIQIEHTPMAYLSPIMRQTSSFSDQTALYPSIAFQLPLFHERASHVHFRLTLNDGIREVKHANYISNPYFHHRVQACLSESYKAFDLTTYLCGCIPGYKSNVPTGLDDPYIHPGDFTCTSICEEGSRWMTLSSKCEPIVQSSCHTIPDHVEPPFFTDKCGYGVATDAKCQECTCYSAWRTNPQDQQVCTHCRLKDTCMIANTDEATFYPKYCLVGRCLCKSGYYGDQCQHQVMYGTLEYRDTATDEQKANPALMNATKDAPLVLPRRVVASLQPRIINNVKTSLIGISMEASVQQVTQILSADQQDVITSIVIALRHASPLEQPSEPSDQQGDSKTIHNMQNMNNRFHPTDVSPFNDLYEAWGQLQESYHNHPVSNDEEYGALDDVKNAYDPHCVPNGYTYCPDGEDNLIPPELQVDEDEIHPIYEEPKDNTTSSTTLYIIIGVVVGVVVLLFVLLVVSILYCRKHQRACFRQKNKKSRRDTTSGGKSNRNSIEISYKPSSGASSNVSSQPPSSVASGSTYLPTQTEVADPTLPPDWIGLEDKNTGKVYYSNKVTMESTWDHPARPKDPEENEYGW